MSLSYSYEIFMPRQNVPGALTELSNISPRDEPPLQITLPGGEQVVVPFTSNRKSDPVDVSAGDRLELETSIMCAVDDAVLEFHDFLDSGRDELGRIMVGIVYLTVRFSPAWHPDFASLEFSAATSDMSRMFEQSASIRQVFTDLTAASGGVCCVFDTESYVSDVCWLNGEPIRETVPGPRFKGFHELIAAWS